ncbi:MAG: hypothetical protein CSB47_03800 [Proteobacteria bacterium]|nr:MAG: hypothetical protein CSB47_03800 [Pseudomonadota bacterium]
MRALSWLGGAMALVVSLSLSAADFTRTEIQQMHRAGVKMKLPTDPAKRPAYVVPDTMSPGQLVQAESVDFSNLPLFSVPPWLAKFSHIRRLDLSNTKIQATGLEQVLQGMPKLDTLNLANNRQLLSGSMKSLSGLWPHLTNLSVLNLSGLSATASQIGSLEPLHQLQRIDLSHNRLNGDLSELNLAKLSGLRELSLANNGLRRSPLAALPVNGLHSLDLSHNALSNLPFVDMPALETLNISGNRDISVDEKFGGLFVMDSLKQLKVDDNVRLPDALKQKFERLELEALAPPYREHAKRYQIHNNGTVSDRNTGLMWKRCSEGQSGEYCQQGKAKEYNWQQAQALKGSRFAGYSDWRVPTIEELRSLVFCSNGTPAEEAWDYACDGKNDRNGSYQRPTINQTAFPNTPASRFWSSSPYAGYSNYAWYVDFYDGDGHPDHKNNSRYVRLVRGGQ